jgi:hypothetical protein
VGSVADVVTSIRLLVGAEWVYKCLGSVYCMSAMPPEQFASGINSDEEPGNVGEVCAGIMRMACEIPAPATGGLVLELKAKGHDEGDDTFEERLPIAKQLEVCCFAPEINGDGAVFSRRLSRYAHVSPPGHQVLLN